ncbi:MAG TPA: SURF1 family protein [Burkholderiales bacterium]|nr:SURF1 family protein [Burkholderiales bacterium]
MNSTTAFRPTWWGGALAVAGCAAFIALGNWQTHRAQDKRALAARVDAALAGPPLSLPAHQVEAADFALRRVLARGEFVPAQTVFLDNKIHQGRVGYEVVTPLRLAGGTLHVLVDRGWTPAGPRRDILPQIPTPVGEQRIEGLALTRLPRAFEPFKRIPRGRVWQNLRLADFSQASGLALLPLVIEQRSATPDGLLRDWPRPDSGAERNESYALQWYLFALLALVLFVVHSYRAGRGRGA